MLQNKLYPHFILRILSAGVFTIIAFLGIGEIWFRLPWNPPLIDYEYNDTLGFRLKPNQKGSALQGAGAVLSPPISLNECGFRNDSMDWASPSILCLGSSEVLGTGVEDNECWTYILQMRLIDSFGVKISVVNAGSPAYGPYHALMVLKSFLNKKRPDLVIVRVSTGDKDFLKPSPSYLFQKKIDSQVSRKIKKYSRFLPYLMAKIEAQKKRISALLSKKSSEPKELFGPYEIKSAADEMWRKSGQYWREIGELCLFDSIPVIFAAFDPIETPATTNLFAILKTNLMDLKNCTIIMLGSEPFELENYSIKERIKIARKTLHIPNDPHANALQHRIIGEELSKVIIKGRYLVPEKKEASQKP